MFLRSKGEMVKEEFSMVEAVYKMINIGLAVSTLPLNEINMDNSHVFFIVHNLFNELAILNLPSPLYSSVKLPPLTVIVAALSIKKAFINMVHHLPDNTCKHKSVSSLYLPRHL